MPELGQNRFGVKLYAFDVQRFVPDAHDFVKVARFILGPRRDFQTIGQGGLFDDQGMITGGGERIGQAFEHTEIVMINRRGFTVHNAFGVDDIAAESIAYALMA